MALETNEWPGITKETRENAMQRLEQQRAERERQREKDLRNQQAQE